LASLEEKSTHREFYYFLEVENKVLDILKDKYLADEATRDDWDQFWGLIVLAVKKVLTCF